MKKYEMILSCNMFDIKWIWSFCERILEAEKGAETGKTRIPKLKVAGSNPVSRSKKFKGLAIQG